MKFLPSSLGGPKFQLTFEDFVMVIRWQADSGLLP